MANTSLNGEDVLLQKSRTYLVIDALYLDRIKEEIPELNRTQWETELKEKVFPYMESPFGIIELVAGEGQEIIKIANIKQVDDADVDSKCFSTDTGLIIILDKSILLDIVKQFEYDKLVDDHGEIDVAYWSELEIKYADYCLALIMTPGVNKGFDFTGSGIYRLDV